MQLLVKLRPLGQQQHLHQRGAMHALLAQAETAQATAEGIQQAMLAEILQNLSPDKPPERSSARQYHG